MTDWRPTSDGIERALTGTHHLRSNTKHQWADARRRLEEGGVSPQDAVLASWEPEGKDVVCGVIVARDGRVIDFCVVYAFDESGRPLEKGVGLITSWKEIPKGRRSLRKELV